VSWYRSMVLRLQQLTPERQLDSCNRLPDAAAKARPMPKPLHKAVRDETPQQSPIEIPKQVMALGPLQAARSSSDS
jgi:hypothetical protein